MRFLYNLLTYLLLLPFAAFWVVRGLGNRIYFDRLGKSAEELVDEPEHVGVRREPEPGPRRRP